MAVAAITYDDLQDPARWDAIGYTLKLSDLDGFDHNDSIVRARRAILLMREGRFYDALHELDPAEGPPAYGLRRLARVGVGAYERVLASEPAPVDVLTPLELEDSMYDAVARGLAATELKRFYEALGYYFVASYIARVLRLTQRMPMLRADELRIRGLMGAPDPDAMARVWAELRSKHPRLRSWGLRTLVEMRLGRGDYERAYRDANEDPPIRALAGALACIEGIEPPEGDSHQERLARALLDRSFMPGLIETPPYHDYARVLRAYGMIRRGHPSAAVRHIGEKPPAYPDQRIFWAGVALVAFGAVGGDAFTPYDPLQVIYTANDAMGELVSATGVLRAMAVYMPDALGALSIHPEAHPDLAGAFASLPLLTEGKVVRNGSTIKAPDNLTRRMLLEAAGGATEDLPKAYNAQVSRYRRYLEREGLSPERVVNLGTLHRVARAMYHRASELHRRQASAWSSVLDEIEGRAPVLRSVHKSV